MRSGPAITLDVGGETREDADSLALALSGAYAFSPFTLALTVSEFGDITDDSVNVAIGALIDWEIVSWSFYSLQVGFGYSSLRDVTRWHLPIGLSTPLVAGSTEKISLVWTANPRLDLERLSTSVDAGGAAVSRTNTGFGLNSGLLVEWRSGWGVRAAFDHLLRDGRNLTTFSIGGHFAFTSVARATPAERRRWVVSPLIVAIGWLIPEPH